MIFTREWNEKDKAYLYAVSFFYCRDDWGKAYIRPDFLAEGLKQNKELFKKFLFAIIEKNQDVWRGIAGICDGLSLNNETRSYSLEIWGFIKEFTEKRLPDCFHEIDVFNFTEDISIEEIGVNLLLSNLNDYNIDNHKTILRYVDKEIQQKNKFVIKWIFKNWICLKLFTKLDILSLLFKNNYNFNENLELINKCIENDNSILSRLLLSFIKIGKNAEEIPAIGQFYGNEEQLFCYTYLFKFRIIHDFCICHGIDSGLFLKIFKEKNQSKKSKDDYSIFYSMSDLRPVDNFYRYNIFLESINEFLKEVREKVDERDLFNSFFALLPLDENITTNSFGPLVSDSNFIQFARFEAREVKKEFNEKKQLTVEKDISITQLENKGNCILLNNVNSICEMLLYDYQIEFIFPYEIMYKYDIKSKEIDGLRSYYVDGKLVAIFQTIKSCFNGIEQYCNRYYMEENGFFLIHRDFLKTISIDFGYSDLEYKNSVKKMTYFG